MTLFRRILVIFLIMVAGSTTYAFDRLFCRSNLGDWIVTLNAKTTTAVLTPLNEHVTLTENESEVLFLKNSKNEEVVAIFPWNSLYVRQSVLSKKNYKVSSKESDMGFLIEIVEKSTKKKRSLNCGFTF